MCDVVCWTHSDNAPSPAGLAWCVVQLVLVRLSPGMELDTDTDQPRLPAPNTFKMYYALSPEMEQTNSIDYLDTPTDNNKLKQTKVLLEEQQTQQR